MKNQLNYFIQTIIIFYGLTLPRVGVAQSYTDAAATGAWNTSRWNNSADGPGYSSAYTAGNHAIFTSGNYAFNGFGATVNVGNITVHDNVTVTMTGVSGNIGTGSNVRTITVGSGSVIDFGSNTTVAVAATGFIKNGPGVFVFAGGMYSGGFTLNDGVVIVSGGNAFGNGATNVLTLNGGTVASNASRNLAAERYGGGIIIGGDVQLGELADNVAHANSGANLTFGGDVSLGNATRTLTVGNNGFQAFSGVISNTAGGITFTANPGVTGYFEIRNTGNTFTGDVTVLGGEARFAADGSVGNSANDIFIDGGSFATITNASYTLNSGRDIFVGDTAGTAISTTGAGSTLAYNGVIADIDGKTGSWAKLGEGVLKLGGANTYTGATTVSEGVLLVNNASGSGTGTGSVLVESGAKLGGSGFITGPSTIHGIHAPGDAVGVLTHGDLAYGGGSSVQWELFGNTASLADRGALFDGIDVGGTLDFTAAIPSFSLAFNSPGSSVNWEHALWGSTQTWLLYDMTGSGGITGWTDQILSPSNWLDGSGKAFNDYLFGSYFDIFEDADGLYLRYNFAVIPEPSRVLLISLGVLGLIFRRRRPQIRLAIESAPPPSAEVVVFLLLKLFLRDHGGGKVIERHEARLFAGGRSVGNGCGQQDAGCGRVVRERPVVKPREAFTGAVVLVEQKGLVLYYIFGDQLAQLGGITPAFIRRIRLQGHAHLSGGAYRFYLIGFVLRRAERRRGDRGDDGQRRDAGHGIHLRRQAGVGGGEDAVFFIGISESLRMGEILAQGVDNAEDGFAESFVTRSGFGLHRLLDAIHQRGHETLGDKQAAVAFIGQAGPSFRKLRLLGELAVGGQQGVEIGGPRGDDEAIFGVVKLQHRLEVRRRRHHRLARPDAEDAVLLADLKRAVRAARQHAELLLDYVLERPEPLDDEGGVDAVQRHGRAGQSDGLLRVQGGEQGEAQVKLLRQFASGKVDDRQFFRGVGFDDLALFFRRHFDESPPGFGEPVFEAERELQGEVGVLRGELAGEEFFRRPSGEGEQPAATAGRVGEGAGVMASAIQGAGTAARGFDGTQPEQVHDFLEGEVGRHLRLVFGGHGLHDLLHDGAEQVRGRIRLQVGERGAADLEAGGDGEEMRGDTRGDEFHSRTRWFGGGGSFSFRRPVALGEEDGGKQRSEKAAFHDTGDRVWVQIRAGSRGVSCGIFLKNGHKADVSSAPSSGLADASVFHVTNSSRHHLKKGPSPSLLHPIS